MQRLIGEQIKVGNDFCHEGRELGQPRLSTGQPEKWSQGQGRN